MAGSMGVLANGKVVNEGDQRFEFCAFDINLEDIDKVVAVYFHEFGEGVHGGMYGWAVIVLWAESIRMEMRTLLESGNILDLRTERVDGKVVAPDLTTGSSFQDGRLE